jgi:hypothetical protein
MSLTQFYALSAPALLGVLAIGFGLFELYRVRRMKVAFAATTAGGMQAASSETVAAKAPETAAPPTGPQASPADPTLPAQSTKDAQTDIAPPLLDWPQGPAGFDTHIVRDGVFVFRRVEENRAPRYTDWTGARYERDETTGQMVQVAAAGQDRPMAAQAEPHKPIDEISQAAAPTEEKTG